MGAAHNGFGVDVAMPSDRLEERAEQISLELRRGGAAQQRHGDLREGLDEPLVDQSACSQSDTICRGVI